MAAVADRRQHRSRQPAGRTIGPVHNPRIYGAPPFTIAAVHGGPGAAGEMAPVARELASAGWGVLEPLQTAMSLEGQVEELSATLKQSGDLPLTLIGFSWGAWLGFIVAAQRPKLVKKLVLVSSGPFEERYAAGIEQTRMDRFTQQERAEAESQMAVLNGAASGDRNAAFARLGALFSKDDALDPIPDTEEPVECRADIFEAVWKQAAELRRSGKLLALGKRIECPVVAIHGDYDPHPSEGVHEPLASVLKDFRFVLLQHCGHKPWIEKQARDRFYQVLAEELR